jgi:hypothetical protein
MRVQFIDVLSKDDLDRALESIRRAKAESILVPPDGLIMANRGVIAEFAQTLRLPVLMVGLQVDS